MIFPATLLFLFTACSGAESPTDKNQQVTEQPSAIQTVAPDSVVICGVRLPIEDPDIRNRFEREFYNTLHNDNMNIQTIASGNEIIPVLRSMLKEEGLPEDLVYLAIAESNLRTAVSVAGATGVWQLMELVSRKEGLKINYWVDERNHLEKSTRAAAAFLKDLYRKYKDWNLVFAAYNVGETNINDNMKFQNTRNFFDLWLNEETSRYVFRVYAAKAIFEQPEKYGLPAWQFRPVTVKSVELKGPVENLAKWAMEQGVSYRTLRVYNPWIKRRGIPEGTWTISLPDNSLAGSINLTDYSYTKLRPVENLTTDKISHKVREGETLVSIALEYDVEVHEIRRWNKLRTDELMTGQTLTIYLR